MGLARARGRAVADRLESESIDFHQRVRQTFRALAEAQPDRYLVLDARHTPDEIAAAVRVRVAQLLSGLPLQQLPAEQRKPVTNGATVPPTTCRRRPRTTRTRRPARPRSCTRERCRGREGVWSQVIGQPAVVAELRAAVTDPAAMTHAWLFTGPPGSGRSVAARAFAAALQCPDGGDGTCHECNTVLAGTDADVQRSYPTACRSAPRRRG